MTTTTWTGDTQMTSDALFRTWGKKLADAMDAVGLTKTADTGQIDWATVTRSGSSNGLHGYEIRYLDDSLHGTCPIYLRIEWRNGTSTSRPSIYLQVATGSDGAGVLTGVQIMTLTAVGATNANGSSASRNGAACFASGCFALLYGYDTGNPGRFHFGVSRTCDPDGTPNADGAMVWYGSGTTPAASTRQYSRVAATSIVGGSPTPGFHSSGFASFDNGSDIYSLGAVTFTDQGFEPMLSPVGVMSADRTAGTTFTMDVCGSTHTYFPTDSTGGVLYMNGASSTCVCAILWE